MIGKTDETGRILLPSEGELSPTGVAMVIASISFSARISLKSCFVPGASPIVLSVLAANFFMMSVSTSHT